MPPINNINKVIVNATSSITRKNKYINNPALHRTIPPDSFQTTSKLQQKIKELYSKYKTEDKNLNINGINTPFIKFKDSISGSNKGYWAIKKDTNELFYIKQGKIEAQTRSEQLANELYNLAGINTPKTNLVTEAIPKTNKYSTETEVTEIASKFVPFEDITKASDVRTVREGFGADCWLANWDGLKKGNVAIENGKAIRLDNGGALCYRARGERKGAIFGEDVKELTSFFGPKSLSLPYLKNMSKEELMSSLKKVADIADDDIIKLVDNASYRKKTGNHWDRLSRQNIYGEFIQTYGIKNPEYLKETLIARKNYIAKFLKQCETTPQQQNEFIGDYIKRVDDLVPKTTHALPFEKYHLSNRVAQGFKDANLAEALTPSQKKFYDSMYGLYYKGRSEIVSHPNANEILTPNAMLHSTSYNPKSFESILDNGIISSEFTKKSGTGEDTLTTLCGDFWDIKKSTSIKDYFNRKPHQCSEGELNFLPNNNTKGGASMVLVFDKTTINPQVLKNSTLAPDFETSILSKDNIIAPHVKYETHRIVPIGVSGNHIDRIILRKDRYSKTEINEMISLIEKKQKNIKIYDTAGNLIYGGKKITPKATQTATKGQQVLNTAEDMILKVPKFYKFGKQGLPLTYPRKDFINDIGNILAEMPTSERAKFLEKFNLKLGNMDIDGIPNLRGVQIITQADKKMANLINKFYNNEIATSNPKAKTELGKILKDFPEFNMVIGKPQHGTHAYSVDIHTLEALKNMVNNPAYEALDKESKKVLKIATLLHDFGKKGNVKTPGHAKESRRLAEQILAHHDELSPETKNRILNMIEYHHWFEAYNKGILTPEQFGKIFPTWNDRSIAAIFAKGDFENINSTFHLKKLIPGTVLTPEQYEKSFNAKIIGLFRDTPNT